MQLARVEVPDDRTLLLHLGLPFFTVGDPKGNIQSPEYYSEPKHRLIEKTSYAHMCEYALV